MKLAHVIFAATSVGCVPGAAQTISAPAVAAVRAPHDSYRAWALCVDTSLSPTPDQFQKLLAVMKTIVERDVTYNDVVWLIQIQSKLEPVEQFVMPAAGSSYRTGRRQAAVALQEAKAPLITAVERMSQVPGNTDLQTPLETAVTLLRSHPKAITRTIVVGSDFLTDTGRGLSMDPPVRSKLAQGISAILLVTYPKPAYLEKLRISPSVLYEGIESKWTAYYERNHAITVTVRLVDSVRVVPKLASAKAAVK